MKSELPRCPTDAEAVVMALERIQLAIHRLCATIEVLKDEDPPEDFTTAVDCAEAEHSTAMKFGEDMEEYFKEHDLGFR